MSEETRDMLYDQLKGTREHLAELWAAIDAAAGCDGRHDDGDDDDDAEQYDECAAGAEYGANEDERREYLDELPLEIVWEKGEPFAVVLGTGGPHVEIRGGTRHDGSSYSLHGYWGGEHVTLSGESITRTGEYFREMVEESDQ